MTELTVAIIDQHTGQLIVENDTPLGAFVAADLAEQLGEAQPFGCAKPEKEIQHPDPTLPQFGPTLRISGWWHDSLVEGPGRRSVVRLQGCPIRCHGCWVPHTHDPDGGYDVSVQLLADGLLDQRWHRDGVTILGGEPFAQARELVKLIRALRERQPDLHITVYTGYTLERLKRAHPYPASIWETLEAINVLIDGPYIQALADSAGPWTGSGNQRVHSFR